MPSKVHLDACIFDASQLHRQPSAVFLHQTRRLLVFFENHKNRRVGNYAPARRNAQGRWGDFRGVQDMQILRTQVFDLTRRRLRGKGGGFKRYAHSAGPDWRLKKVHFHGLQAKPLTAMCRKFDSASNALVGVEF